MEEPIRVLQVVNYMNCGGLETMLMNYYRNIDRNKIQFDFLTHRTEEKAYDKEILSLGGKIYHMPELNPFSLKYRKSLDEFFCEHTEYKIAHAHLDCMSPIPLYYAKKHGVPIRIAHAHSSSQEHNLKFLLKMYYRTKISKESTHLFACGNEAGRWMFGRNKDYTLMYNAVEAGKFAYNEQLRQEVKKELNLEGKFVVGCIARFVAIKNHDFMLDVMNEICKKNKDSVLLLAGRGPLQEQTENKAHLLGLDENVRFLGVRSDTHRLLQAMDVFLLTSHFEGLPVTTVEAQASGTKCVLSSNIPTQCALVEDLVDFIDLKVSAEDWAEHILQYKDFQKKNTYDDICKADFDIKTNAQWLQNFYLDHHNAGI